VRILVAGATGYVGGRLVPRLLESGHEVRVLSRDPARIAGRQWAARVHAVRGDVLREETLGPALAGVDAAFYLVHGMGADAGFAERDVRAGTAFGRAARAAGVSRIVYLGGLGDAGAPDLSAHLASRHATGDALRAGGVPVTELRAAIVVGAGSASFEIVRYLVERLPVMLCPRWVYQRVQPIAIADVVSYLAAALDEPRSAGTIVEIGGADVLTYQEMMLRYARARGLRRRLVPVPVLTPRLSAYWVHWVTPVIGGIARPLIQGLRNEVVVRSPLARELFPAIEPLSYDEALQAALANVERGELESRWSDALASSWGDREAFALETREGLVVERREVAVAAPPEATFAAFAGLGGERGWPAGGWLWRVRGGIDRLFGGVGLRRGRRHPDELRVGDAVDFWRVEAVEPGRLLRLRAEMKVPGRAWLEFEAEPAPGGSRLVQTAFFAPRGLAGLVYWWGLYPVHGLIFSALARRIAARARGTRLRPAVKVGA
jgi:uncharacterized protein YbjT (DUF2867 family)